MKYLIVGRSGVGKDYIANMLKDLYGMIILKSYTTRPKRVKDENTHIFINKEDSNKYTDKVAKTVINGYEYFSTKQQVQNSDIYIIDPNGLYELLSNMPDEDFCIMYIYTNNKDLHTKMAINRSDNSKKELEIFNRRYNSENKQFSEFEEKLSNNKNFSNNVKSIIQINNTYDSNNLKTTLQQIFEKGLI